MGAREFDAVRASRSIASRSNTRERASIPSVHSLPLARAISESRSSALAASSGLSLRTAARISSPSPARLAHRREYAALEREADHYGRRGREVKARRWRSPIVPYDAVSFARAPAACTARERVTAS